MNFLPTSYEAIGWLVVGLASLCVAINQIDDFFERRKTKPGFPPAEQLENSQEALADRVVRLEQAVGDIRREMKEDREALSRAGSARAAGIYKKIDEVRAELSANLESARREMGENQRSLPNEIVALLKNTNAI
jgi:predicted  nucleic acid-binding Zn-ribbon protein